MNTTRAFAKAVSGLTKLYRQTSRSRGTRSGGSHSYGLPCSSSATAPDQDPNSFIVAKPFQPLRLVCIPGAVLLLPHSLVRTGTLRSIFIFPTGPGARA